jgi:DNA-binding helix-hairpin-helix protein with protein kinase domain
VNAPMSPLVVDVTAVREGRVLGRGGQGRVVEVTECSGWSVSEPLVAKWYLPSVRLDAAALTRLISWRRSLEASERAAVDTIACWPRGVLLRHGRASGVLLPRVPPRFSLPVLLPSGSRGQLLRELQYLIAGPALLARRQIPDVGLMTRLRLLEAFVAGVAKLHGHGVVLGDLSVKNVLWTSAGGPAIYLLDCDALRLTGMDPAVRQPNSPGWDDPAFPGTQNQQSDRYKLALTVLRVLARDFHTRDPERAVAALGREFMPILRAGLSTEPDSRPAATAWSELLRRRVAQLSVDNPEKETDRHE